MTGVGEGDKIKYTLSRAAGENVGGYAITPSGDVAQGNYTVDYVPGTLTITKAKVTVTITGHKNSAPYDGKNHSVNGYDVSISNPLYNVTDFTFNGTAKANRTDAGTTNMGLKSDMFVNNNQNFEVTFIVDSDGYQEIVPINVEVTITGHHDVSIYNGATHTVSGYDVSVSNPVYKEDYFTFSGTAKASRVDNGITNMGLSSDQFANTSKNFKTVTFSVADGYQWITSVSEVVVTITGHRNATPYDGKNHSVSGYDVEISNPLYKKSYFTFSGTAEASRTNAGTTNMGLKSSMFVNNNQNFGSVIFNVNDGYQTIVSINVVATITGQKDTVIYDGTEHVVEGYNVVFSNPVCTAADIAFSGTDVASQVDVGTTNMGLSSEQFANVNNNFDSVLFRVTDGYQTIEPKSVTVMTGSASRAYDGTPLTNSEASITGLVPGEKATVIAKGSQTDVGSSTNTYEIVWDSAKATNYIVVTENLGTLMVTEKIVEQSDIAVTIDGSNDGSQYDGSAKKPKVIVDGRELDSNDYDVTYKDAAGNEVSEPKDAGTYTMTITGKGNYTGTTTQQITIKQATPKYAPLTEPIDGTQALSEQEKSLSNPTGVDDQKLSGTWKWSDNAENLRAGKKKYPVTFNPDDANYTSITSDVVVSTWGAEKNNGTAEKPIYNYVAKDGTTSAEVTGNDIIWLKEESEGSSTWYGLENPKDEFGKGVFAEGSKFWVRWLSISEDSKEWKDYYEKLDDEHKKLAEDKKLWIFLVGVTGPDGKEYHGGFDQPINLYIQLGTDWDMDDINAVFISDASDEVLSVQTLNKYTLPDGRKAMVAKVGLRHFSPYAVYDKVDDYGSYEDDNKSEDENSAENVKSDVDSKFADGVSSANAYSSDAYTSDSVSKTSDVMTVDFLLELEMLMMLSLIGLYFSWKRKRI